MGLSSALATAMSGLRANQAALSITSANVANAQYARLCHPERQPDRADQRRPRRGCPGHRRQPRARSVYPEPVAHRNVRRRLCRPDLEYSGPAAKPLWDAGWRRDARNRIQQFYDGVAGDVDEFQRASRRRPRRWRAAQALAQQLNSTTQGIQTLRTNVEQDIGTCVTEANTDLTQIASINTQLQGFGPTDPAAASLMDQRDNAINDLANLMDVRTVTDSANQTNVFTNAGIQLVGAGVASQFSFTSPGTLNAHLALQHRSDQIRRRVADRSSFPTAPTSTWSRTS